MNENINKNFQLNDTNKTYTIRFFFKRQYTRHKANINKAKSCIKTNVITAQASHCYRVNFHQKF